MIDLGVCLRYYKRPEIQKVIVEAAKDKEVSIRYPDDSFGKRPDILINPSDVIENVKQKASSFHCSEELWKNPLQIQTGMKKDDLTRLRKGWDLVLDIDCPFWELSKISAWLFIEALKRHGINSISLKFSGNKGFHIGVPFKAFPETVPGKDILTKDYFPEGPRRIASYLVDYIERNLIKIEDNDIVNFGGKFKYSFNKLKEMTGKDISELTTKFVIKSGRELKVRETKENVHIKNHYLCPKCGNDEVLDVFVDYIKCRKCGSLVTVSAINKKKEENQTYRKFNSVSLVNVDTILIAPRHLYRMVYSLHEKSGLASIPIDVSRVLIFEKSEANPDSVLVSNLVFLDDTKTIHGEAEKLLIKSFDFNPIIETEEEEKKIKRVFAIVNEEVTKEIPEELFPPCIKLILQGGIKDGKKRCMFILINFLTSAGWDYEKIKERLDVWNKSNPEQLRETLIVTHLNYHKQQRKEILPPNCPRRENNVPVIQQNYYTDLQLCHPDNLCVRIKNPLQYAKKKAWLINQQVGKKKKVKEVAIKNDK